MLIELLSQSNYISFNIKLAEILGLHSAIYLAEIMSINDKAIRKDKVNESSFILDREYVAKRTTIPLEEQLDIEKNLEKIGIIEKPNNEDNAIILNINMLTTLMMSTDEELVDNVKLASKAKKKRGTKAEGIKLNLRSNIVTQNQELREAYFDWIDAVFAKQGWMSKSSVVAAQQIVDNFSNRDLDKALKLIEIASVNGYRDMNWAVDKFSSQYSVRRQFATNNNPVPVAVPVVSNEVF